MCGGGGVGKGLFFNFCAPHSAVRVSGIRTGEAINAATCEVEQSVCALHPTCFRPRKQNYLFLILLLTKIR